MAVPNFLKQFNQYMFDQYSKDGGKLLIHMGAAGWVFSSLAQIGMLLGDKSIDKKEKKFLLPQESVDAVVNVLMSYSVCDLIKRGGDHFVENGKFVTDKVVNDILKIAPKDAHLDKNNWKDIFTKEEQKTKISKLLENSDKLDFAKNFNESEKKVLKEAAQKALNTFENHKNNVGVVTAIASSILACNLITPYVRNKVASKVQKKLQHNEDLEIRKQQISKNITMKGPLPTSFKAFNNYNTFSGLKI